MVYLATLEGYIMLCCPCIVPNLTLVACCLVFPSFTPPENRFHIPSNTSQPTVPKWIWKYRNFPKAGLESLQTICNHHPNMQGFVSKLFQLHLSPDTESMVLLQELSHPYFLPLLKVLQFGCTMLWPNCSKESSICFKLIGAFHSALPKADKLSLT
jgi:hypothetical protein